MSDPAEPEQGQEYAELYDGDPGLNIITLRRRRELVLTVAALIVIVAVTGFTAWSILYVPVPSANELTILAQGAVRDALPAGVAVQFGGKEETSVTLKGEEEYEVAGRVLAVTPQGMARAYSFTCALAPSPAGVWRPAKLLVTPE
jgi:hypothetical protein